MTKFRPFRRILQMLPKRLRFALLRRNVRVPEVPPGCLEFRLANDQDELEQAYRILHESYVEMGYAAPNSTGLRITKYFALPTTSTLVALYDGEVIGTMSVIRESSFGLPMEKSFDLSTLRERNLRIAEVSSLAIDRNFRAQRGAVFFPLCKFFYDYVRFYMGLDAVVIAVNPSWTDFYEGLLMFKTLKAKVIDEYDFANGAPAVGLYLALRQSEVDFYRNYARRSPEKNLHHYFVRSTPPNTIFPNRDYEKSLDPVMTPEALDYFFRQKSDVFENLTIDECKLLRSYYPSSEYYFVLPPIPNDDVRIAARYVVNSWAFAPKVDTDLLHVRDVSESGLQIFGSELPDSPFELHLKIGAGKTAHLLVRAIWRDRDRRLSGVKIEASNAIWQEYIAYLDNGLRRAQ